MESPKNDKRQHTLPRSARRIQVPLRQGAGRRANVTPQAPEVDLLASSRELTTKIRRRRDIVPATLRALRTLPGRIWKLPRKVLISLCLVLLIVGYLALNHSTPSNPKSAKGTATTIKGRSVLEHNAKPSFPTVVPSGKTIAELGGWTRVSPDNRAPVYAYADKLNNVTIRVSEQKLPPNISGGSTESINDKIEKLSIDFKADQKLTVGTIKAYIGTSSKGPQSVIFAKNDLLILITSDQKIDNNHWTAYISSLQ